MKRQISLILSSIMILFLLSGCDGGSPVDDSTTGDNTAMMESRDFSSSVSAILSASVQASEKKAFPASVVADKLDFEIDANLPADFSIDSISNLDDMEKAYGFKFSEDELTFLGTNKFVIKPLLETNIRPEENRNYDAREFVSLYNRVKGPTDASGRLPENTVFWTADVFFHTYNLLYTELLKEIENTIFYPNMKELSKQFYLQSEAKLESASDENDQAKWAKIRNYFAIPYAIFETAQPLPDMNSYSDAEGNWVDPMTVMEDFKAKDDDYDSQERVTAFIMGLGIDEENQGLILESIEDVYKADGKGAPAIFADEFKAIYDKYGISYNVDYTQFTPRSHYTGSSLRRQYFRGMKWYIDTPFLLLSPKLTDYAFGISQLLAENLKQLEDYNQMESTIHFLVGNSDDLMPVDYMQAVYGARNAEDQEAEIMKYLIDAKNPMIKSLQADFDQVGQFTSEELKMGTKGMRFFSGKFIIDSYWTDYLTQGDEAIQEGYTQKLPPLASSLEIMSLMGSDYASSQIPKLDFYTDSTKEAIDQAIQELRTETEAFDTEYWQKDVYNSWVYTIRGLFDFDKKYGEQLPAFMQSDLWSIKNLMTASGFWTELRHATLLYAKQSFAEMGAGFAPCEDKKIPAPTKSYIEPQYLAYQRLANLAKKTKDGLYDMGYEDLRNLSPLDAFTSLMDTILEYSEKELKNTEMTETTKEETYDISEEEGGPCLVEVIEESDWEVLRTEIQQGLLASLPVPTEGPVLLPKDKRAAIVADVHTGGDSATPTQIIYEGVGVPYVIFVAVSDVNGPRLTVGFMYSHYEFRKDYGGKRLTDENWQANFYKDSGMYESYDYLNPDTAPEMNFWYKALFNE